MHANDALVREFLLLWEQCDTDKLFASCTEDFVWHHGPSRRRSAATASASSHNGSPMSLAGLRDPPPSCRRPGRHERATGPCDRIERLALLCTSPGGPDAASYPLHTLADLSPEERLATGLTILDRRFTPERPADHAVDKMIVDGFVQRQQADHTPDEARGLAEQLAARSHHDVVDRLCRVACPTLVASGRYDGIAPVANGELIASRIPGATLHIYEGGHLFVFQDPAAFPEIISFLTIPSA